MGGVWLEVRQTLLNCRIVLEEETRHAALSRLVPFLGGEWMVLENTPKCRRVGRSDWEPRRLGACHACAGWKGMVS
jgi:hypothetical protein